MEIVSYLNSFYLQFAEGVYYKGVYRGRIQVTKKIGSACPIRDTLEESEDWLLSYDGQSVLDSYYNGDIAR
jgi:hypothetical protein